MSDCQCNRQALTHPNAMADKVPDLRAARAEFTGYIADKNRYISITEQQGPLRPGESKLRAGRRQYIKKTLQWDTHKACWLNRDGRPLIPRDIIWVTIIAEMRKLDTYGQRKVWGVVQGKFDGIYEDDVRAACKAWSKHHLCLLDPDEDSQWDISPEAQTNTIHPVDPSSINGPGLGYTGDMRVGEPLSSSTGVVIHPSELQSDSFKGQKLVEGSKLGQDSCQINNSPSAGSQPDYHLPDDNCDDPSNLALEEERINQNNMERAASKDTPRASPSGCQYLQSVIDDCYNDLRTEENQRARDDYQKTDKPSNPTTQDGQHDDDNDEEFCGFSDCSSTPPKLERKRERSQGIQSIIPTAKYMS